MSSITKDAHDPPKSPFWIACYNGIGNDGRVKRFKKSTKTTNKKLAKKIADELEKAEKLKGQGRLTESHCRKVLAQIYEEAVGETLHFDSARDYLLEWLNGAKNEVEGRSYWRYEQTINLFLDHLGSKAGHLLREISQTDVRSWRDKLKAEGKSPPTVNGHVAVLKMAFKRAHDSGYIEINPCAAVKPLKDKANVSKDTFTIEQVAALLRAAPSGDWQGLVLAGFFTGLRLRDCADLQWSSVDLDEEIITVETKKTRKTVVVPIHPQLLSWLKKQTRGIGRAPVFRSLSGKPGSGGSGLSMTFRAIMRKAGVVGRLLRESNGAGRSQSSLSFHSLRHSCVSALASKGVSLELRQELIGHSSQEMAMHYAHLNLDLKRAAMLKLPMIPQSKAKR